MIKIKEILLFTSILLLMVGLVTASEVTLDDTGSTIDAMVADDTSTVSQTDTENMNDNNILTSESTTKTLDKKTSNRDDVKQAPVTSWDTLVTEVNTAKNAQQDTTITLQPGSYVNTGMITWDKSGIVLTIDGNGQTIDGNQGQVFRINSGCSLVLKNITITNSISNNGAIYNNRGTLTIINSTLENNNSTRVGGAICNNRGTLTIINSTLKNNTAQNGGAIYIALGNSIIIGSTLNDNKIDTDTDTGLYGYGGAIFASGRGSSLTNSGGNLTIYNTTLNNNIATDSGGAIYNRWTNLTINQSTLENNSALDGGAIFISPTTWMNDDYKVDPSIITVTDSTLNNNTSNRTGGAIYNADNLTVSNSTLTNNKVDNWGYFPSGGGAIYNSGTLSVNNSTLENNNVKSELYWYYVINIGGGAIFNYMGNMTVTNSNLNNNSAEHDGGAILNVGANLILSKSTLEYNTATRFGGAIANGERSVKSVTDNIINTVNAYYSVTDSNFTQNHAGNGSAIYSANESTVGNITNNRFSRNTAENSETLDLNGTRKVEHNVYDYTDILFKTVNVSVKDNKEYFIIGDDVELEFTLELENPDNYDSDILENEDKLTIDKKIILNDDEYDTTTTDTYTLSNLGYGEYNVCYTTWINTSNTATFTLFRYGSEITIDPISDVVYGDEIVISGLLLNEESSGLSDQIVTLTFNDEEIELTTINGEFNHTITITTVGENTVTVAYAGNDRYNSSESQATFTSQKADITLTLDEIETVKKGETVTISGTVKDNKDKVMAGSVIKLLINNGRKTLKADNEGKFTFDYTLTRVGENNITATFQENDHYNEAVKKVTAEVLPLNTSITINPIEPVYKGQSVTITGKITDENGENLAYTQVRVFVNGSPKTLRTDANGVFTHTYVMGKDGENNISVEYAGSNSYISSEASTTVKVSKSASVIIIDSLGTINKGDNVTITGRIIDENANAIVGVQVKITVNGNPKTVKCDSDGVFTHTYIMNCLGENEITVIFNGNNNFLATNTTSIVEVVKT